MSAYGLCQQMMHVFHQFRLYVTFEVMEPAWIGMQSSLDKAHTLDEVSAMPAFLQQNQVGALKVDSPVLEVPQCKYIQSEHP